jgi:hypothetical protein
MFYEPIHNYYGYDTSKFNIKEHVMDERDILKLYSLPFRFALSGVHQSDPNHPQTNELNKWMMNALITGYRRVVEGEIIFPKLIHPKNIQ